MECGDPVAAAILCKKCYLFPSSEGRHRSKWPKFYDPHNIAALCLARHHLALRGAPCKRTRAY